MYSVDAQLFVVLHHLILTNSSKAHIAMRLHIKDASYTSLMQQVDVSLCLWIGSQPQASLPNLVKPHVADKIGISFLHMAVDYKDWEDISPQI